jgi:metal-sulfur cluster biosynthetic enzyme
MAEQNSPSVDDPMADESGPAYCVYTDYSEDTPSETSLPATGEDSTGLERQVWDALYGIDDPEMPVSIVDLGLIYGVRTIEETEDTTDAADTSGTRVAIDMTLTYTGCPARDMLREEIEAEARSVEGVSEVSLELVWSPNWSLDMVTEQGRADLREFGLSVPEGEEA